MFWPNYESAKAMQSDFESQVLASKETHEKLMDSMKTELDSQEASSLTRSKVKQAVDKVKKEFKASTTQFSVTTTGAN